MDISPRPPPCPCVGEKLSEEDEPLRLGTKLLPVQRPGWPGCCCCLGRAFFLLDTEGGGE